MDFDCFFLGCVFLGNCSVDLKCYIPIMYGRTMGAHTLLISTLLRIEFGLIQHYAGKTGYGRGVGAGKLAYACQCGGAWCRTGGGGGCGVVRHGAWSRDFAHRQPG